MNSDLVPTHDEVSRARGSTYRLIGGTLIGSALLVVLVAVVSGLALFGGYEPVDVLIALWRGAVGSSYAFVSATLVRATPLVLTGLAVAIAFRCGILNIGADGQFLSGAAADTLVALAGYGRLGGLLLPSICAAGLVAGAAWALVPAFLRRRFGVLEVISTIMMNFVALHAVGYLVRGPLQEPLRIYPQSATLSESAHLPLLVPGSRLHIGFGVAIVLCVIAWAVLRFTAAGFRVRAIGSNPTAARVAGGIDVHATTMRVFLVSGAIAGLAGAVEVSGVTYALYENISPGYGYTAIAVALLGGLDPLRIALSGVFFGALEAGGAAVQRDAGAPSTLVAVIEAALILCLLTGAWLRERFAERRLCPSDRSAEMGTVSGGP